MKAKAEVISVGCQVEVDLVDRQGNKEHLRVLIVPDDAADFAHGYLSLNTPLAQALLGEKSGTTIPYLKDDIYSIEVLSVTKSTTEPTKEAANQRRASLRKAIREVEDTNAIVFASSFSGKWGDYDPDSIPKEKDPDHSE